MKLLLLSFYFEPDLCAGSFRCTSLVEQLSKYDNLEVDVITTLPNRYASFASEAPESQKNGNVLVHRIRLPKHNSGVIDQAKAFFVFYREAVRLSKEGSYDAVFATSSRLFTAYLGARIARKKGIPLYLDIRDIFLDTISDVFSGLIALATKPIFGFVERFTFASAKRINLVSEGFREYFMDRYSAAEYRWFTNGIDEEFTQFACATQARPDGERKVILYAGNIGEGQGLHNIVPQLAKRLEGKYIFRIVGDGGRKELLKQSVLETSCNSVELLAPVERQQLVTEYINADILFIHLNDYPAFEKVLPSKIFECAATGKPILAGIAGYSAGFVSKEVINAEVFSPGNVDQAIEALELLSPEVTDRHIFCQKFSRSKIMQEMAGDIVEFIEGSQS